MAVFNGTTGTDVLFGLDVDDTLNGLGGIDVLVGGDGNDTYIVDDSSDEVIENSNQGTADTVQSSVSYTLSDNVENLVLTGTATINGTGNQDDNNITGNSGNNVIDGGAGDDIMAGGLGNDTYIVDSTDDIVSEAANAGIDTIQSTVTYILSDDTLTGNVENLVLRGTQNIDGTGNRLANLLIGNSGINTLTGGAGNDTYVINTVGDAVIETNAAPTEIDTVLSSIGYTLSANVEKLTLTSAASINGFGNDLANTMTGNIGDNVLNGGLGNDTMAGGLGNDEYVVNVLTDVVTEAANAGNDTVRSEINYTLGVNLENLVLEPGSAAISGTGNAVSNSIFGNGNNNIINGGAGNDTMAGGLGNDTYIVDATLDVVDEDLNEGTDSVQSSVTYILSADIENLTLTGSAVISGTGNDSANTIIGNTANNTLDGGLGNDTLDGGLGNDTIAGGAGNDSLTGGAGNDSLIGGAGNDIYMVDAIGDAITEAVGAGIDSVFSSVTFALSPDVDNLTLTGTTAINGTGSDIANTMTGNSANNIMDGRDGNDSLVGGLGNDNLVGNTGDDTLVGGNENDTLNGGLGIDSLIGGTGNNTYVVDSIADVISGEIADDITTTAVREGGIDLVQSSASIALATNLENLTLIGTTAINGSGNFDNNIIIGNSADNTLNGGGGNDTMDGGAGNDILDGFVGNDSMLGGLGNDTYVVNALGDFINDAGGTDLVRTSITYTLGSSVENLELLGGTNINGIGNEFANTITGNSGRNVLNGGGGNDTLISNDGNDLLVGGAGADRFQFAGVTGIDSVNDFTAGLDQLVVSRSGFGLTSAAGNGFSVAGEFASVADDATAETSFARIVFSQESNGVFYNLNGNAAGFGTGGGQFAELVGVTTLLATDFTLA